VAYIFVFAFAALLAECTDDCSRLTRSGEVLLMTRSGEVLLTRSGEVLLVSSAGVWY
jgi:hypothetical protein